MEVMKKYHGTDMNEILERIRRELGENAVLYQSSSRKRLLTGSLEYEVLAGANEAVSMPFARKQQVSEYKKSEIQSLIRDVRQSRSENKEDMPVVQKNEPSVSRVEESKVLEELKLLRTLLHSALPQAQLGEPESMRKIRCHLLNNGAEQESVEKFCSSLFTLLKNRIQSLTYAQVAQVSKVLLEKSFFGIRRDKARISRRITVVVGPTGSGKTTTLAKLVSKAVIAEKREAVVISLDSYRLGAHAQLKAYTDILSVPFYSAASPEEFKRIVNSFSSATRIFVDTSGVSPQNGMAIRKTASFLFSLKDVWIALLIPASNMPFQIRDILHKFLPLGYHSLILTKVDELISFGHLLSLSRMSIPGIDFFTNGQEVPKDIMDYSAGYLAKQIMQVE